VFCRLVVIAGKAKAGMAHSDCGWTCGCAGKTMKSLENMRHTGALLLWWFTMKRCYIKCMDLYLLPLPFCSWYVVSTSASDWLERLVSEMTYNALMGTLNPTHSFTLTHSPTKRDTELINWLHSATVFPPMRVWTSRFKNSFIRFSVAKLSNS